jgi:hypothetical protein
MSIRRCVLSPLEFVAQNRQHHKDTKITKKAAIKKFLIAAFFVIFVPLCLCGVTA